MKNKITLSGFAGSGKSTTGEMIGKKLDYEFISVGNYTRTFAKEYYNLTINEFQEKCKKQPELDFQIDEKFRTICNSKKHIVIDYRLGFKFVDNAFHVLLKVSDEMAATRINLAMRENELTSPEGINNRNSMMRLRFLETYDVDFTNERNYDLVISTDHLNPIQVATTIINAYQNYKSK